MRKPSVIAIYLATAMLFLALSMGWLVVTDGYALRRSMYGEGEGAYMDYYVHISYSHYLDEAYNISPHACFPPLAKTIYYCIGRLGAMGFPTLNREYFITDSVNSVTQMYLLVGVILLSCSILVLSFKWLCRFPEKQRWMIAFGILLSCVWCIGVLERANIAGILAVLLPLAMLLKDADKPWKRELALILIAVAAGIKIYPAVFGLVYVKERRWKEAARLIVYGLACFFVPFVWFGGIDGFRQFLANTAEIQGSTMTTYSIDGRLAFVFGALGVRLPAWLAGAPGVVASAAAIVFGAGSAILTALGPQRRANWVDAALLCGICLLCPCWVGLYTVCMLLLPLLMFLRETQGMRLQWWNIAACLGFALAFSTNLLMRYEEMVDLVFFGVLVVALLAWGIRIVEIFKEYRGRSLIRRVS